MIKITNERPKWLTNKFIKWLVIGIGVAAVTFYIICEALVFGNAPYAAKAHQCGIRPVTMRFDNWAIGGEVTRYTIRTNPGWFDEKTGLTETFCTVEEAKGSKATQHTEFLVK